MALHTKSISIKLLKYKLQVYLSDDLTNRQGCFKKCISANARVII